jgi:hypothetical protein
MAQFLGSVQGQRGQVTRLGSKSSGLEVRANGWTVGVCVAATHVDGKDVFHVFRTAGSNGYGASELIATITESEA